MAIPSRDRPDTYVVPENVVLPDLTDLLGVDGGVETDAVSVVDTYLDTAGSDLRRSGASLRRRSGGPQEGWRLTLPAGASRTEVGSPSRGRTAPKALVDLVLGLTRGRPLGPVAELSTVGAATRWLDAAGTLLAEVVDAQVSSTTLDPEARSDSWRELAVAVGPAADPALRVTVGDRLRACGATAVCSSHGLDRALGPVPAQPVRGDAPTTLADLVGAFVSTQCAEIVAGDLALRLGEPRVHRTRVAIRRLRSTVRVFADILDPAPAHRLDTELSRLAALLGEVRDREVLLQRLQGQLAELDPALVLGPVSADLDALLSGERSRALRRLTEELRTPRQLELLEALARWTAEPPFLEGASAPAKRVKDFVDAAQSKMQRRLREALVVAPHQEERLHRARKAAKRARYAAELALPGWTKADAAVAEAKHLQTQLGEHQDSVVAAEFLRQAGAVAGARNGRNGFTYGILLAQEWRRAATVRAGLGLRA